MVFCMATAVLGGVRVFTTIVPANAANSFCVEKEGKPPAVAPLPGNNLLRLPDLADDASGPRPLAHWILSCPIAACKRLIHNHDSL